MTKKRRILQFLNLYRLIPAWIILWLQPETRRKLILDEMEHWNRCTQRFAKGHFDMMSMLLIELKEYRSLYAFRMGVSRVSWLDCFFDRWKLFILIAGTSDRDYLFNMDLRLTSAQNP